MAPLCHLEGMFFLTLPEACTSPFWLITACIPSLHSHPAWLHRQSEYLQELLSFHKYRIYCIFQPIYLQERSCLHWWVGSPWRTMVLARLFLENTSAIILKRSRNEHSTSSSFLKFPHLAGRGCWLAQDCIWWSLQPATLFGVSAIPWAHLKRSSSQCGSQKQDEMTEVGLGHVAILSPWLLSGCHRPQDKVARVGHYPELPLSVVRTDDSARQ